MKKSSTKFQVIGTAKNGRRVYLSRIGSKAKGFKTRFFDKKGECNEFFKDYKSAKTIFDKILYHEPAYLEGIKNLRVISVTGKKEEVLFLEISA